MRLEASRLKDVVVLAACLLFCAAARDGAGALPDSEEVWTGTSSKDWQSIEIDASGYPHCAWVEHSGSYGVYYLRWNGEEWVDTDGSGVEAACVYSTSGTVYDLTLKLDDTGCPHLAWTDNHLYGSYGYDVYYLRWNGVAWADADGTGTESMNMSMTADSSYFGGCSFPSLGVDSLCRPHIAWYCNDTGMGQGWYLRWNGVAWVDADDTGRESPVIYAGSFGAGMPRMALDRTDTPHVAWSAWASGSYYNHYDVYYLRGSGGAWVDVDGTGMESMNVSRTAPYSYSHDPEVAVDSSCCAHLFWCEGTSGLWYWRWNGSYWADVDGSSLESSVVTADTAMHTRDLVLDSADRPVIEYYAKSGSVITAVYCLRWDGAAWTDLDGSGTESGVLPVGGRTAVLGVGPDSVVHYLWLDGGTTVRYSYVRDYPRADVSLPSGGSFEIPVAYTLTDPESVECRIEASYSLDGGASYQTAAEGDGGDGTEELVSGPSGVSHTFVWNAFEDLGVGASSEVTFRITPFDSGGRGMRGCTEAFGTDFSDSDGDGLADFEEDAAGSDPYAADTDEDGLSDYEEFLYDGARGGNPYRTASNPSGTDTDFANADTDGDGWSDLVEVAGGSDPLEGSSAPSTVAISFATATVARPAGFATDCGRSFDLGRGYGWE